jgi:hypothetical protein
LQRPAPVAPESHPDAALLTAFAEQSLSVRERDDVVAHLAHCGDCREVVALALPASELLEVARQSVSTRAAWLRWPVLRWSVVAVGIVAVTSVGVLQHRLRQEKSATPAFMARSQVSLMEENRTASALRESPQKDVSPLALPAPTLGQPTDKNKTSTSRTEMALDKASPTVNGAFPRADLKRGASAGGAKAGGAMAGSSSGAMIGGAQKASSGSTSNVVNFAPAVPAPGAAGKQNLPAQAAHAFEASRNSQMVEVQSAAPMAKTDTIAQNRIHGQNEAVVRAKTQGQSAADLATAPMLRWTISAAGALQRSLDGGKSWQDVNIAVDTSLSSNLVGGSQNEGVTVEARSESKAAAPEATPETTKDAKSNAKALARANKKSAYGAALAQAPPVFRALAVSSNASEVWAGGSGGALYHTMDAGNLWVRIVPSDAGVVLASDIISIQFSDPGNGTVTTSNAQVWTTSDAGQTWHKQ